MENDQNYFSTDAAKRAGVIKLRQLARAKTGLYTCGRTGLEDKDGSGNQARPDETDSVLDCLFV